MADNRIHVGNSPELAKAFPTMKNVSWDNSYDSYSVSMVFKPFMYSPLDWTLISETELRRKKFEISFKNHKRMYDFSHIALLVYR